MNVDPNGPCPMEYHAAREWEALQSGKPPAPAMGVAYALPTEYHAREAYLKKYSEGRERYLRSH